MHGSRVSRRVRVLLAAGVVSAFVVAAVPSAPRGGAAAQEATTHVISGRLTFSDGDPVAGYDVGAWAMYDAFFTTTNSSGRWSMEVPDGTYNVEFRANNRGGSDWDNWLGGRNTVAYQEDARDVVVDRDVSGLSAVVPRTLPIGGTVTNRAGDPLQGVTVRIYRDDQSPGTDDPLVTQRTAADGGYSFRLKPNRYIATFEPPNESLLPVTEWPMNFRGAVDLDVVLRGLVPIDGRVKVAVGLGRISSDMANGDFPPARVTWRTSLDAPDTTYYVEMKWDFWQDWSFSYPTPETARWLEDRLGMRAGRIFRVRAVTAAGDTSRWITSKAYRANGIQEGSATFTGAWTSVARGWGGSLRQSSAAGARARMTFTGTAVGLVSATGPDRGQVDIHLDGQKVQRLSLFAPRGGGKRVVWASPPLSNTSHTIEVVVVGRGVDASAGARVDVDGFVTVVPM